MTHDDVVRQVVDMLQESGRHSYGGEAVSQLEHALQAAYLAEQSGKDEEFIVACLLHDLGHLTPEAQEVFDATDVTAANGGEVRERQRDEAAGHGAAGAQFLKDVTTERMRWLIANHATAKRYLCAVAPGYYDRLSPVSKQTLEHQGGPMSPEEVAEFEQHPWREDLVVLRHFDDEAKVQDLPTPDLDHYRPLLERHLAGKP